MRLLHTGDLHLKSTGEDSEFSLECLDLLVKEANEKRVDALLFCGDVFDGEKDYRDDEFFGKVAAVLKRAEMEVVYIPGNHESQHADYEKLKARDWPAGVKLLTKPQIYSLPEGVEILAIPHATDYEQYSKWEIEDKKAKVRIAIAHGEIPGFEFLGDEGDAGVLNTSIFAHYGVSHVFLGHIHKATNQTISGIEFCYAGSSRPVRTKEVGIRGYNVIEIGDEVKVDRVDFEDVGQMRRVSVSVTDSAWAEDVKSSVDEFGAKDRVKFLLSGITEGMDKIKADTEALEIELGGRCRRVEFSVGEVKSVEDLLENEFYKKFHTEWLKKKPVDSDEEKVKIWSQVLPLLQEMVKKP